MLTALLSFLAGLLTALAPCVLPLLPVILGGSLDAQSAKDRRRPYIIIASLLASLILFTILLKASTVLIGVDPIVWVYVSGSLVILLGVFMLFPNLWAQVIAAVGIEHRSQTLLSKAFQTKNRTASAILTGAALGPVFSSCSPTYAWVIATVLPANVALGVVYLGLYCLGLAVALLAIALLGRKLLARVSWAANPTGWFQRGIAILFILVGLFIITGWDKKVQTWLVDKDPFNLIQLEQELVPENNGTTEESTSSSKPQAVYDANNVLNVAPYPAPQFAGITDWVNSDPLTMHQLRGKVVLVDFWTYSCINCQRTQPYLNAWYDKYREKGLVIVGVHAPEFAFEKVLRNVKHAVDEEGIKYPVALDNDFKTWQAYSNRFWPAKYLIDKNGQVRYTKFGEGDYDKTEQAIQLLLNTRGSGVSSLLNANSEAYRQDQTPETYLNYSRGERFANVDQFFNDKVINYRLANSLSQDEWSLGGLWQVGAEQSEALDGQGNVLRIKFTAKEVYLVMDGPRDHTARLELNGQKVTALNVGGEDVNTKGEVTLDGPRLYKLISLPVFKRDQILDIHVPEHTTVNAFTFGS